MNLNFVESNPIPVKASLALLGLCEESFRLPLCPPTRGDARGAARARCASWGCSVTLAAPTCAERIEALSALPAEALGEEARAVFDELLDALERGEVRRPSPVPTAGASTPG